MELIKTNYTDEETAANREIWVDALLSDEYTQAKGILSNGTSFCCLGVACDLFMKITGKGQWSMNLQTSPEYVTDVGRANGLIFAVGDYTSLTVLPTPVQDWLGLSHSNGRFRVEKGVNALSEMNDKGATFKEIAVVIRTEKGILGDYKL